MKSYCRLHRGFTIIEMLVVVAIITVLLGLLVPALRGVRKNSRKLEEVHAIRQVGVAWNQYANANKGAALPGYLETDVQEAWDAQYEFLGGSAIPPAPAWDGLNIAGPWTWRLLPYLDYSHDMVHGHLGEEDFDRVSMTLDRITADGALLGEALAIAQQPAFGYNAFYVGGWWEMVSMNGNVIPRYRYYNATADRNGDGTVGADEYASVVVRAPAQIKRSSELVLFCSSSRLDPGLHHTWADNTAGWHYVVPPFLGDEPQWRIQPELQTTSVIEVVAGTPDDPIPAPIGRYTDHAAVLYADGHADSQAPGTLVDQRKWINIAETWDFQHLP